MSSPPASPEQAGGRPLLGLIVNPVAGLGGTVGLKGSDGLEIQERARRLGAVAASGRRALEALRPLQRVASEFDVITYPGEMGEEAALAAGLRPMVIGSIQPGQTTAKDTRRAARDLMRRGASLILFAGGDGTARDICQAVGTEAMVLGIPAGVKIHSAAFAITPGRAGETAAQFLRGRLRTPREVEVLDLDEEAFRQGKVAARLYGYLKVPFERNALQARKSPNPLSEGAALDAVALDVIDSMDDETFYIVGPGTTTRPILEHLGLGKTLLGVDVVRSRRLVAADANEAALLALPSDTPAKIVVTPIGGQGYLFGRGNQPISPAVLRRVGRQGILIVSPVEKVHALEGRPLLIDSGDPEIDRMLCGYWRVITGYHERIVYRAECG